MMNKALKRRWVKALRSGDYPQTQGALKTDAGFCCLGVLCELQHSVASSWAWADANAPGGIDPVFVKGLTAEDIDILIAANDDERWTFAEIADYVEAML